MNEIINKFSLAGDQFVPEMHLRQLGFTYSACGSLTKNKEDLTSKTASDKILRDKAFNIAKNPKYDGYQRGLAAMVYNFSDKKASGGGIKNENMSDRHN